MQACRQREGFAAPGAVRMSCCTNRKDSGTATLTLSLSLSLSFSRATTIRFTSAMAPAKTPFVCPAFSADPPHGRTVAAGSIARKHRPSVRTVGIRSPGTKKRERRQTREKKDATRTTANKTIHGGTQTLGVWDTQSDQKGEQAGRNLFDFASHHIISLCGTALSLSVRWHGGGGHAEMPVHRHHFRVSRPEATKHGRSGEMK